jgi:succinate dehydrogenase/fumarate reductase cytochrome b subunit
MYGFKQMLTIFTTVKNESASILEWLAFHKLQGFRHFLLGIDQCNDNTKELIENSQFAWALNILLGIPVYTWLVC